MDTSESPTNGIGTYVLAYVVILGIAVLQLVIAYEPIDSFQRFVRMLLLAIVQAGLAITFFMQMKSEKRSLALFLLPATVFILAMMNMIWSDSFRLLTMRPFAH